MTTLVEDAMLKEAADAIERHGCGVSAEFLPAKGAILLRLTETPYTEIILKVED